MLCHVIVRIFSDVSKDFSAFKVKVKVKAKASNDMASYRRRLKFSAVQNSPTCSLKVPSDGS
jgi:hypothetical protein